MLHNPCLLVQFHLVVDSMIKTCTSATQEANLHSRGGRLCSRDSRWGEGGYAFTRTRRCSRHGAGGEDYISFLQSGKMSDATGSLNNNAGMPLPPALVQVTFLTIEGE